MKRPAKILIVTVAALVLLLLALSILVNVVVTPEGVRRTLLPLAEDALQREIRFEDIDIGLFSGITLDGLVILDRGGVGSFVAADRLVLRYRLWPLLFLRVVVEEIRLDAPRIQLSRLRDGSFNFSDLLQRAGPAAAGSREQRATAKENSSFDLFVSTVTIENGSLLFTDHRIQPTASQHYTLEALTVTVRDISLHRAFPFRLKTRLNGSAVEAGGELNVDTLRGRVEVSVAELDARPFIPYFGAQFPGNPGRASLDLRVDFGPESATARGSIALKGMELPLDAVPGGVIRDAALALDYALTANLAASTLDLDRCAVSLNGIPVNVSGRVEGFTNRPVLDLTVRLADLELRPVLAALPSQLADPLADLDPAGTVSATVHLAGPVAEPAGLLHNGEVRLAGVAFTAGGYRPLLSGVLSISDGSVRSEELRVHLGEDEAVVRMEVGNLFSMPIAVSALVSAHRLHLDPFIEKPEGAGQPTKQPQVEAEPAGRGGRGEPGPFELPFRVKGRLEAEQVFSHGLAIEDVRMDCRLEDNVFVVERLTARLAGGRLSKTARLDLGEKGLGYATQVQLDGTRADPLVTALAPPLGGTVFGVLDLDARLTGSGTVPETIRSRLSGSGELSVTGAKITGAGLAESLADYLDLEELRILRFSHARGSFRIQDGAVSLTSEFSGSDVRMSPRGKIGLDGSVDLALNTRLSPELTRKLDKRGQVALYLTDANGWGHLPLKVTGTLTAPRLAVDLDALKGTAEKKAEDILDRLAPREERQSREPVRDLLEDAVRELFRH
jgi:AsmA protein